MKTNKMVTIFIIFTLIITSNIYAQDGFWTRDQFKENNRNTNRYYLSYIGDITAFFSNSANNNTVTKIRNLTFSNTTGLSFSTPQITSFYPAFEIEEVKIIIVIGDDIQEFIGTWDTQANVSVPYSQELLNALLNDGIKIILYQEKRSYKFDFPKGFTTSWTRYF